MAYKSVFFFVIVHSLTFSDASILCETGFCRTYELDVGCASTHIHCNVNNATHTGLSLPSPTECNCCPYCMPFYLEGQHCSLGGTGTGTIIGRCGDGLSCQQEADGNFCRRMDSDCHRAQDDFDERHGNGMTGALEQRPLCDGKGRYEAYDCVPTQTCFCLSPDGERIFGEFLYSGPETLQRKHCACSRANYEIQKSIGVTSLTAVLAPRCSFDGSYNPVQCIERTCYCVDRETGDIIHDESIDLDVHPISRLSCYDREDDIFPSQTQGDSNFNYTTPCLHSINAMVELIVESQEQGYNVDYYNQVADCLPDGTYGRIGFLNGMQVCVNHRNRRIGDYEAAPDSEDGINMDCKCAATTSLMTSTNEHPVCCKNGNFRPIQCRRGLCRCVDSNGRQTEQDTADITKLSCYNANAFDC